MGMPPRICAAARERLGRLEVELGAVRELNRKHVSVSPSPSAWAYGQGDHGLLPPPGHEDWAKHPRSDAFAAANQHYEQAHMKGHAPAQAPDYVAPKGKSKR